MNRRGTQRLAAAVGALALIGLIVYGVYSLGVSRGREMAGAAPTPSDQSGRGALSAGDIDQATGKEVPRAEGEAEERVDGGGRPPRRERGDRDRGERRRERG